MPCSVAIDTNQHITEPIHTLWEGLQKDCRALVSVVLDPMLNLEREVSLAIE